MIVLSLVHWRQGLVEFDARGTLEADPRRLQRKRREKKTKERKEKTRTQRRENNEKRKTTRTKPYW